MLSGSADAVRIEGASATARAESNAASVLAQTQHGLALLADRVHRLEEDRSSYEGAAVAREQAYDARLHAIARAADDAKISWTADLQKLRDETARAGKALAGRLDSLQPSVWQEKIGAEGRQMGLRGAGRGRAEAREGEQRRGRPRPRGGDAGLHR